MAKMAPLECDSAGWRDGPLPGPGGALCDRHSCGEED